jgi:hypothetical protein
MKIPARASERQSGKQANYGSKKKVQVSQTPEVDGITRTARLRQWRVPHLAEDGVGAEWALLDLAVRGSRRSVAEHLVLGLLLLVLRRVRLSILPQAAGVVGGRSAAEAVGRGGLAAVGPIGGHGLRRGHGRKVLVLEGPVRGLRCATLGVGGSCGQDAGRPGEDGGLERGTRERQGSQGVRPSPPWLPRTGPVPTCRRGTPRFCLHSARSHAAMFQWTRVVLTLTIPSGSER